MGRDKAFLEFEGRSLLERSIEVARCITSDVRIVGSAGKFGGLAPVVEDIFPDRGPLGGIHAALRNSTSEFNLILAVDMPFLSPALLQHLVDRARASNALVTLPRTADGWQPLCAVYRRGFQELAETALRAGKNKIDLLFDGIDLCVVSNDELMTSGFSPSLFRNLNTTRDLVDANSEGQKP
jgi:molybdenum cofactor guanylyltransferase